VSAKNYEKWLRIDELIAVKGLSFWPTLFIVIIQF